MTEVIEQVKTQEIEQGKEKRNVPKLRFREFKDKWKEKKLGSLGSFLKGNGLSKADLSYDGQECILYGELYTKYNEVITNIQSKTNLEDKNFIRSKINDVIIPSSGETAIDIATASCVKKDNVILGGDLNVFRPNDVDGIFVSYQLNNQKRTEIAKIAQGASVVHVYNEQLKKVKICITEIQEQKKIADFFSLVDKKIEKQSEKVEALKTYKKGIMQKIFKQEIRFKDENGKEYPEWEKKRLGEILRERKLYCKKGLDYPHVTLSKDGIYDKSERYDRDFLVKNDNKDYKVTLKNDICYNPANLKFGVICRNKYGSAIFSPIYVTFEIINCNSIFIEHLVTRSNFINKVRKYEEGTVYERMSVKPENLLKFNIKIPDLREQTKIAEFLTTIDEKMDKEEKKLEELKVWKKGLLQKMFV